ncbi:MAG: hypothetical protein Q7U75_04655, partial [Desulfobacterales bacterium]|nr:hypothetical protein [Desulfobacterales bacterium]
MIPGIGMALEEGARLGGEQSPAMKLQYLCAAQIIQFEDQGTLFGQSKVPMLNPHQGENPAAVSAGIENLFPSRETETLNYFSGDRMLAKQSGFRPETVDGPA